MADSEIVKWHRLRLKMTQVQFAAAMKVTRRMVAYWESGKCKVPAHRLEFMAMLLQKAGG